MVSSMGKLNLIPRFTRRYCTGDRSGSLFSMSDVGKAVSPSVVGILSYFSGAEAPHSAIRSTGVFVDRKLIVTTASTVGRVSTIFDSDSSSVLHNCVVSRTIALTEGGKLLKTNPLAVHFAGDLAVLEVAEAETKRNWPPPCPVADASAEDDSPLFAIAVRADRTEHLCLGLYVPKVMKSTRPKAPWPLDEELGWLDYGFSNTDVGVRGSVAVETFSGTPWFSFQKELAGVSSWAAADADGDMTAYFVPPLRIKSIIEYAITKQPHDPIVIDRWINNHTISISDHDEECVAATWPRKCVIHVGHSSLYAC